MPRPVPHPFPSPRPKPGRATEAGRRQRPENTRPPASPTTHTSRGAHATALSRPPIVGQSLKFSVFWCQVEALAAGFDNWRWTGTRFCLRTGKALGRDRMEIVVRFRPAPHHPFDRSPSANRLRFGLEPESLSLELTGTGAGAGATLSLVPLPLSAEMPPPELPAYGRILLDVLRGDATLSIRADEAEEAWRILTPVLEAWSRDLVPLEEYDAGSGGPPER